MEAPGRRHLLLGMAFALSIAGSGCGRLTINIKTVFSEDGSCSRTIHAIAEGVFASILSDTPTKREGGWATERYMEGDKLHLIATYHVEHFPRGRSVNLGGPDLPKDTPPGTLQAPTVSLRVTNYILFSVYGYTETLPSSPPQEKRCSTCGGTGRTSCFLCNGKGCTTCFNCAGTGRDFSFVSGQYEQCGVCGGGGTVRCDYCGGTGSVTCSSCGGTGLPGASEQMGEQMARSMFSAQSEVQLPGRITKSNSDRVRRNTASWLLSLDSLTGGKTMRAESRHENWAVIGALALLGLGSALLWVRSVTRRARRGAASLSAAGGEPQVTSTWPEPHPASARPDTATPCTWVHSQPRERTGRPQAPDTVARRDNADIPSAARALLAQKEFRAVVHLLSPWLAQHADDPDAWDTLAAAHFELQQWPEAERAAGQVVTLKPSNARALCNWGTALRRAGRVEEARDAQLRALRIAPRYERAQDELRKIDRTGG